MAKKPTYQELERRVKELEKEAFQRKRAEGALRESEKKYRQLVENLHEGIWSVDQDSYTTFVNQRMAEMLGYTRREMQGRHLFSFMDEDSKKICERHLERRKQGIKEQHDFEFIRKDGTRAYTRLEASPITDDKGRYIGGIASVMDITELKRVEEMLKQSEEEYRGIIENILDVYYRADLEGNVMLVSPSAVTLLGYNSRDELTGKNLAKDFYFRPEDRQIFLTEVEKYGKVVSYEVTLKRKDGTPVTGETSSQFVYDEAGKPVAIEGIFRDITERKLAEEALRESEEKFRLAFEKAVDAIFWADSKTGLIVNCNAAAETLLEKGRREIVGQHQITLHPPEKAGYYTNMLRRDIQEEGSGIDEAEVITKSGKIIPVHITASVTSVGKKSIMQSIFRNITERKLAEETLKESEEMARALLNAPTDVAMVVDTKGIILDVNETAARRFRRHRDELVGMCAYDLMSPAVAERRKAFVNELLHAGKAVRFEDERDGIWNDNVVYPIFDSEKKITKIAIMARDVTERKRSEEALRKSEETARALLNAPTESALLLDTEGTIIALNETAHERLGKSTEKLVGANVFDLFPPDVARDRKAQVHEVVSSGDHVRYEDKRQGMYFDNSIYPILDAHGKVERIAVFARDITDRKKAEDELSKARDELEQRVKERTAELVTVNEQLMLEIKERKRLQSSLVKTHEQLRNLSSSRLAAQELERKRISQELHDDLGQVLTAILLDVVHAKKLKIAGPSSAHSFLERIQAGTEEALQRVRNLSAALRPEVLDSLGLEAAVVSFLEDIRERTGMNVIEEMEIGGEKIPEPISVASYRIFQEAMTNIIKHAAAKQVTVKLRCDQRAITLSITDDGQGFNPESSPADEGLGLLGMKERAEQLGGVLRIESAPGGGTKVHAEIPLTAENETV